MIPKLFIRRYSPVAAVQVPPKGAFGLQSQVLAQLPAMFGEDLGAAAFDDEGVLRIPFPSENPEAPFDMFEANPGDWLVQDTSGPMCYTGGEFAAMYLDPTIEETTIKQVAMPVDMAVPPVLLAAVQQLAKDPTWPAVDHNTFVGLLAHLARVSLPPGYVGLPVDRLWQLDRTDYEKLRGIFPNLPDMPQLVTLDTSIGVRR